MAGLFCPLFTLPDSLFPELQVLALSLAFSGDAIAIGFC